MARKKKPVRSPVTKDTGPNDVEKFTITIPVSENDMRRLDRMSGTDSVEDFVAHLVRTAIY